MEQVKSADTHSSPLHLLKSRPSIQPHSKSIKTISPSHLMRPVPTANAWPPHTQLLRFGTPFLTLVPITAIWRTWLVPLVCPTAKSPTMPCVPSTLLPTVRDSEINTFNEFYAMAVNKNMLRYSKMLKNTSYSYMYEFIFHVLTVFLLFQIYAVLQEHIFKQLPDFHYAWSLTLFQFIIYSSIAFLMVPKDSRKPSKPFPFLSFALVGFLAIVTIGASNKSIQFLSYPTQVIFKSCKLLPVMAVGVLLMRKTYEPLHYVSVSMLTIGLVVFSVGDSFVNVSFDVYGIFLISLALLSDAFIGNVQEKVMKQHKYSAMEMIAYSKGIGAVLLFLISAGSGELIPFILYCISNPSTLPLVLSFSIVGAVGEVFVMKMVKRFGALVAVTVTSMRKVFTILVSFLLFPKPMSHFHVIGLFIVGSGIAMNIYVKNKSLIRSWLKPMQIRSSIV